MFVSQELPLMINFQVRNPHLAGAPGLGGLIPSASGSTSNFPLQNPAMLLSKDRPAPCLYDSCVQVLVEPSCSSG